MILSGYIEPDIPSGSSSEAFDPPKTLREGRLGKWHGIQNLDELIDDYLLSAINPNTGFVRKPPTRGVLSSRRSLRRSLRQPKESLNPQKFIDHTPRRIVRTSMPATPPRARQRQQGGRRRRFHHGAPEKLENPPIFHFLGKPSLTMPFNVTGQPAATICCGFSSEGYPLAFQLAGRAFDEASVFAAGAAYERATTWRSHRPKL